MTDHEIARLGPAFARYLRRFRPCFRQRRTAEHFDRYCAGLLADLPRKSVEPIALASGTAVRTLQLFLTTAHWDHEQARDRLQRQLVEFLRGLPPDPLGTVGVIDETSCRKQGAQTPGVQRQYLGCLGKVDNGIVTVHVGVARGGFQALLDAELYLPQSWDQDRPRCRQAGIPDQVRYRAKWQLALDQLIRLHHNGVRFDWLTFDEGYGSKVPFLKVLRELGQPFVAEVPVSFAVRALHGRRTRRADELLPGRRARRGTCYRLPRRTLADARWRAVSRAVRVGEYEYLLIVAINEATAEVKYFLSNALQTPLRRLLQVAFRRATIEHGFRVAKSEAGLMHYEGRRYEGLVRHLILGLIVLGFVSMQTDRLRGEKSGVNAGASVPGAERALCRDVSASARDGGGDAGRSGDSLPPAPQRPGDGLPQAAAA